VTRRRAEAENLLVRRAARRLGLQAAAFVAVAVVLVTGAAVAVLLDDQERAAQNLLDATIALADDVHDPPLDTFLVIRTPNGLAATAGLPPGADDPAALDAAAAGAPVTTNDRHVGGVDYRVTTQRRADGLTVQAVLDLSARQADRRRILVAMIGSGAAGLVLAAAAGTWLVRRALRPLGAALALQRRFVADAGHELRTPLTLLGTRAQLLRRRLQHVRDGGGAPATWQDGGSSDPSLSGSTVARLALDDVEGIVGDSGRLTAILEDLLLAADPLADRPRGPVDLAAVCRDVVRAATATAQQHGVTLHGPAADGPSVEVVGSAVALHRSVTALVDNALRHACSSASVAVGCERGLAVVDVSDDGPGVDPALAPRLFDRFATGPAEPVPDRRRYGLGLALVAEITAAHRGHVELRPRAGRDGTIVRISLPPSSDARLQGTSETAPRRSYG
jgi:two-component system, OmpR family, sensor kinase